MFARSLCWLGSQDTYRSCEISFLKNFSCIFQLILIFSSTYSRSTSVLCWLVFLKIEKQERLELVKWQFNNHITCKSVEGTKYFDLNWFSEVLMRRSRKFTFGKCAVVRANLVKIMRKIFQLIALFISTYPKSLSMEMPSKNHLIYPRY